jgi:hypothetical protein
MPIQPIKSHAAVHHAAVPPLKSSRLPRKTPANVNENLPKRVIDSFFDDALGILDG